MIKTQAFPMPGGSGTAGQRAHARVGSTVRRAQRLRGLTTAKRILGIDPGLHITGYGVIELASEAPRSLAGKIAVRGVNSNDVRLIEGGVLKPRASDDLPARLQSLYDGLRDVLREHEPDTVVIEELFSTYAHPRSALLLAQARGVLALAAQQSGAHVHSFTPNEVKQVVSGNGHATKSAMQQAVKRRLKLATAPHPPDVADALALALCFAARQGTNI